MQMAYLLLLQGFSSRVSVSGPVGMTAARNLLFGPDDVF
jgi:hypothetical protein